MLDREAATRPGLVEAVVRAGVDWLQLRDRESEGGALLALAQDLRRAAARGGSARLVVNRRTDVALACAADGVHLGFDAVTPGEARALLGPAAEVGISAHDPDEIAAASGASYAHLAPIHDPLSKAASRPPLGLAAIGDAAARGIPVLAQGGLHAGNARAAIHAGASGIAVTGAILQADDPAQATRRLREALDA